MGRPPDGKDRKTEERRRGRRGRQEGGRGRREGGETRRLDRVTGKIGKTWKEGKSDVQLEFTRITDFAQNLEFCVVYLRVIYRTQHIL